MVNRLSQPEIITVNSEALQTQIRDLLPSQNGFGSELQASNVITPIIDLTAAAEGSGLPVAMQNALSFGSQTSFDVRNTTTTIINSTGFFRILGSCNYVPLTGSTAYAEFYLNDGATSKMIYQFLAPQQTTPNTDIVTLDFVVFLAAGHSLIGFTNSTSVGLAGSHRQIATGDGTLVPPNGFPL